jgi:hypothetical protein
MMKIPWGFTTMKQFLALAILAFSLGLNTGSAQVGNATLVGRVEDPGGAVIAGAQVEARRISTNEIFRAITTGTGDYSIVNLPVDQYEIKAASSGFKTEIRGGVMLEVGATLRVNFRLQVGSLTESVEVNAQSPILQTESPEFGHVVQEAKIERLPLNTRDVLGTLGGLMPGVTPNRANSQTSGNGDNFNVRGQRGSDNLVLIDGTMVSQGNAAVTFFESPEAVQEFEIKTGLYSAEYGVKPGGQFIMITKSGSNTPHGSLFELLRNNDLDARNFFDKISRPPYKRNQFGGVFGAPIYIPKLFHGKDKAWFFFSYAGERISQFQSLTGVVPTVAQRGGPFTTSIKDPSTGQPFPGNTIPAARINPIAQKLIGFYPDPNTTGQGFNFTSPNSSSRTNNDQIVAKVDVNLSANDRWSARFLYDNSPVPRTSTIQTFYRVDPLSSWTQQITNTRTVRSKVVNVFSANFYRRPYYAGLQSSIKGYGNTLNIPGFPISQTDIDGVPSISVTGFLGLGDGTKSGPSITGNWEVRDNVSVNSGSHSFKFGYNWRRHIEAYAFIKRSSFAFQPRYTGNAFADFLLGDAQSTIPGSEDLRGRTYQNGHYFYAEDSWKVSSRLTFDVGLRYEYRGPLIDQRGFAANFFPATNTFSPGLQPLQLQPWQTGRFYPNQPLISFNKRDFQPRIGLAYRLTDKTVIRSGFGIFGNEPVLGVTMNMGRNPRPNVTTLTYLSDPTTPNLTLSNPFPSTISASAAAPTITAFQSPLPITQVYGWGFAVQRQLAANFALEVGYQGSHAAHDYIIYDANDATPGPGAIQSRRPYPLWQQIVLTGAAGDSHYNGLEIKLEKRFGGSGVSMIAAYTWAKTIDNMGGRLNDAGDPTNVSRNMTLKNNRGEGEGNPNRFVYSLGYELPFGKGKPLLSHGAAATIAGGWSFNSIVTFQTGAYVTAVIPSDIWNVGSTDTLRPNVLRDPNLPAAQRTPQHWFDTGAFAMPAQYQYGNAARSIVEAPGLINVDMSLHRTFQVTEKATLQFRFDAFNATNHTNFAIPGLSYGTATFGVVGGSAESRDLQLGLKFRF